MIEDLVGALVECLIGCMVEGFVGVLIGASVVSLIGGMACLIATVLMFCFEMVRLGAEGSASSLLSNPLNGLSSL